MKLRQNVLVYGTFKRGFYNYDAVLARQPDAAFVAEGVTTERFPLFVDHYKIPYLVHRAGEGRRVSGELFAVGPAVRVDAGATAALRGCAFEGILTEGLTNGAAVEVAGAADLENCAFRRCSAYQGGAVHAAAGGRASLRGCALEGNAAANHGGAVYAAAGARGVRVGPRELPQPRQGPVGAEERRGVLAPRARPRQGQETSPHGAAALEPALLVQNDSRSGHRSSFWCRVTHAWNILEHRSSF